MCVCLIGVKHIHMIIQPSLPSSVLDKSQILENHLTIFELTKTDMLQLLILIRLHLTHIIEEAAEFSYTSIKHI